MAALTKQILDFTSNGLDGITEADRVALLQASTKLAETIENPMEMMLRMFFVSSPEFWIYTLREFPPKAMQNV
jgi:hypothetical protein